MPSPIINDVTPFIQYSATEGQTVFVYPFAIFEDADVRVYKRPADSSPSDATQLLELALDYTVTDAGSDDGGTIVLTTGAGVGDIITVIRALALERRTTFQPGTLTDASLNQEFNNLLAMVQDLNMAVAKIIPAYNFAAIFDQNNKKLPTLPAGHIWRMNDSGTGIESVEVPDDDPGASILRADLASHNALKGASLVGIVGGAGTVQDFYTAANAEILALQTKLTGINRVNYGVDTGAVNALEVALPIPITAYADGQLFLVKVAITNTLASTIDIDGIGAKAIKYLDGSSLGANDLVAGKTAIMSFSVSADCMVLVNPDYARTPDFPALIAETGYQKLPSGLIIQWGRVTMPASGTATSDVVATFAIPFPTAVFSVTTSYDGDPDPSFEHVTTAAQSTSPTGFIFTGDTGDAVATFTQTVTGFYIAIGH